MRPLSGDGILGLFKNEKEDPQKKTDKEEISKVRGARLMEALCLQLCLFFPA
jgi:hypothetical protein